MTVDIFLPIKFVLWIPVCHSLFNEITIFFTVKYIKKVDGLAGCYRGLAPKVIGSIVSSVGSEKIAIKLGFEKIPDDNKDERELTDEES